MSAIIKNNKLILTNPITNKNIGEIALCNESSFSKIEENANKYNDWKELHLNDRSKLISKFRKSILHNKDKILEILINETGKKEFDAFTELFTTLEHLKGITKIAKKSLKKSRRNPGLLKNKKAYVQYEALGTIGVISPWNYSLVTPITTISEALLAGNNVILKPSEHTSLIIQFLKIIWDQEINYNNAFQVIYGDGSIGEMLVKSTKNDMICFTNQNNRGVG